MAVQDTGRPTQTRQQGGRQTGDTGDQGFGNVDATTQQREVKGLRNGSWGRDREVGEVKGASRWTNRDTCRRTCLSRTVQDVKIFTKILSVYLGDATSRLVTMCQASLEQPCTTSQNSTDKRRRRWLWKTSSAPILFSIENYNIFLHLSMLHCHILLLLIYTFLAEHATTYLHMMFAKKLRMKKYKYVTAENQNCQTSGQIFINSLKIGNFRPK